MKRKTGTGLNNFWKIQCLDCGVNCDLLTDNWKRIICRECLEKHEFKEVEHEGLSESDSEVDTGRTSQEDDEKDTFLFVTNQLLNDYRSGRLQKPVNDDGAI